MAMTDDQALDQVAGRIREQGAWRREGEQQTETDRAVLDRIARSISGKGLCQLLDEDAAPQPQAPAAQPRQPSNPVVNSLHHGSVQTRQARPSVSHRSHAPGQWPTTSMQGTGPVTPADKLYAAMRQRFVQENGEDSGIDLFGIRIPTWALVAGGGGLLLLLLLPMLLGGQDAQRKESGSNGIVVVR